MVDELRAELELDASSAERAVEELSKFIDAQLAEAAQSIGQALIDSVDASSSGITDAIQSAIAGVQAEVPVTADTAQLPDEISTAVESVDSTVVIEADASSIPGEIDAALSDADTTISVEVDTSSVATAEGDVQGLDDELGTLTEQAKSTGGGLTAAGDGANFLSSGLSLAEGSAGGASSALAAIGPAGAVIAGTAVVVGSLFEAGLATTGAFERLNLIFGESAGLVERINVGGLVGDLSELSQQSGNSATALRNAIADVAQLGIQGGRTAEEVAKTSNELSALSLTIAATHPEAGEANVIFGQLVKTFATGKGNVAKFGIEISKADVATRAAAIALADGREEASRFDKIIAGTQLSVESFNGELGAKFQQGLSLSQTKVKAVGQTFEDLKGTLGEPLVSPLLEVLKDYAALAPVIGVTLRLLLLPIEGVAKGFSNAADAAGDLVGIWKSAASGVRNLLASGLDRIGTLLEKFTHIDLGPVGDFFGKLASGASDLVSFLPGVGAALGVTTDAVSGSTKAVGDQAAAVAAATDAFETFISTVVEGMPTVETVIDSATEAAHNFGASLTPEVLTDQLTQSLADIETWATQIESLTAFGLGNIATTIAEEGPGSELSASLSASTPEALVALNDILGTYDTGSQKVVDRLREALGPEAAQAIIDGVPQLEGAGKQSSDAMEQALPTEDDGKKKGDSFIGGIISGVNDKLGDLLTFFKELPGKIINALTELPGQLRTFASELPGNFVEGFGNVKDTLKEKGKELLQGLKDGLGEKLADVKTFFTELPGKVIGFLGPLARKLVGKGKELLGGILTGFEEKGPEILAFIVTLPLRLILSAALFSTALIPKGIELLGGLFTGIVTKAFEVLTWFQALPGNIITFIGDVAETLVPKGIDLMGGFFTGIMTKAFEILTFFVELPPKIPKLLGNLLDVLVQAGEDIMEGLKNGLEAGATKVKNFVTDFVKEAIDLIKHPWEVNSPSKVTLELGLSIMEGFSIGLERGIPQIAGTMDRLEGVVKGADLSIGTSLLDEIPDVVRRAEQIVSNASFGEITRASVPRVSIPTAIGAQSSSTTNQITVQVLGGVPDKATASVVGDEIGERITAQLDGRTRRKAVNSVRTG